MAGRGRKRSPSCRPPPAVAAGHRLRRGDENGGPVAGGLGLDSHRLRPVGAWRRPSTASVLSSPGRWCGWRRRPPAQRAASPSRLWDNQHLRTRPLSSRAQARPGRANTRESGNLAKAQAAMEQKMKELDAQPPIAPAPPPSMKPKTIKGLPAFPPLKGPPPAVAADKEQRLQELLRKYRADQVTPEEYHQQRAKILAEP